MKTLHLKSKSENVYFMTYNEDQFYIPALQLVYNEDINHDSFSFRLEHLRRIKRTYLVQPALGQLIFSLRKKTVVSLTSTGLLH